MRDVVEQEILYTRLHKAHRELYTATTVRSQMVPVNRATSSSQRRRGRYPLPVLCRR